MCLSISYYLRCLTCNCLRKKSKDQSISSKKHSQLEKGRQKLYRDLDIVNLLEMIKDYHLMKQVLFDQDDRFFLQLQHRDMICESTTEDDMRSKSNKIVSLNTNRAGFVDHLEILDEK